MIISGCDTCEDTCVLLCAGGAAVHLRAALRPHFDDIVSFRAEVTDDQLTAGLDVTTWEGDGLTGFLTGLAEDFRGWDGTRTWRSLSGELIIAAVHRSRGYVALTWTLDRASGPAGPSPGDEERPGWSARVTTIVEAGEAMRRLADHVGVLLDVDRPETAVRGGGRGWHRWLPGRGRS